MAALQNLIPDPTTRDLWQCRPGAVVEVVFAPPIFGDPFSSGFSSGFGTGSSFAATFISCWKVVGTRIYGMVSTNTFPGHDVPFIFDTATNAFVPITGATSANTPLSPLTSGPWTPPNIDLIGSKFIVAHPGFSGAGGAFFGVLDITNPAAPTWTATNTATNALPTPPQWVQNFGGRCFFLVNPPTGQPAAYMSDVLVPTTITNATQVITFGDNTPLTCAVGLPLANQLGGIIQSLMVFKDASNIYQVTGDFALSNLAVNTLNVATGTKSPLSVVSTSKGLAFLAPDGLRVIDFSARVSDPVGNSGDGVTVPFIFSLVPSRVCAAYNVGVYRIQVQNGNAAGNPQQQWWFDIVRGIWNGPHTQAAYQLAPLGSSFIAALQGDTTATIYMTDVVQSASSVFTEQGNALSWLWQTPMLPDTDQMAEVAMIESTIHMALLANNPVNVSAVNQNGTVADAVQIVTTATGTIWGTFTWGAAAWEGLANALYPRQLAWHYPIVFRRIGIAASGMSNASIKLGRMHLRYEVLSYLQEAS
jgi:hypothetical protein